MRRVCRKERRLSDRRCLRFGGLCALVFGLVCIGSWSCRAQQKPPSETALEDARAKLVRLLARQGISDKAVLTAIGSVPRHRFVPAGKLSQAYENYPLSIGLDQTISQPYIVAHMSASLALTGKERVLEVGTGSGYQAAVLAELAGQVYSIEILPELSKRAGEVLASLSYRNIHLRVGDGYAGWKEHAPFDAIMVTASPAAVPPPLIAQLKEGGRLSIPVGPSGDQVLFTYQKRQGRLVELDRMAVRFVPMTGKALR